MSWIKELKREIADVPAYRLPPFRLAIRPEPEWKLVTCRKCGAAQTKDEGKTWMGPAVIYEPPFMPSRWQRMLGKKPTPERMRRECPHCKAVYYEAALSNRT